MVQSGTSYSQSQRESRVSESSVKEIVPHQVSHYQTGIRQDVSQSVSQASREQGGQSSQAGQGSQVIQSRPGVQSFGVEDSHSLQYRTTQDVGNTGLSVSQHEGRTGGSLPIGITSGDQQAISQARYSQTGYKYYQPATEGMQRPQPTSGRQSAIYSADKPMPPESMYASRGEGQQII